MRVTEMAGNLEFVPEGCTFIVQPLDVAIMKSFKSHTRNQWKTENTNKAGDCDRIGLRDAVNIVSQAWESVDLLVIVNGFEAAFRPAPIDAGVQQALDEEEVDPGLEFVDIVDHEIVMD
jgi:hypothetical protein